jgi:ribosomal protein RSM22 (predicted rRNA methylase)
MDYPSELETWWLTAAQRETGLAEDACLMSLEADVARLSDLFTTDRPAAFRDYAVDARQRLAYGLFFFPQTFTRVWQVAQPWLTAGGRPTARPLRVLDLGSGTGASTLAVAHALQPHALSLTAVDHSPESLTCLSQLFADLSSLWPGATLATRVGHAAQDGLPGPFDLIVASFVLNELFPPPNDTACQAWITAQLARLAPDGALMIVEPAGQTTSPRLQRLRNARAADGSARILAPCPHSRPCPLVGAACGWCHDVRRWRVPDSVNRLNRRLCRSVHDLKHSLLVLTRPDASLPVPAWQGDPACFRMVGPMSRIKGRLRARGCCGDGNLRDVELMTRGMTRQQENALTDWDRGDVVRMAGARLLGDGHTLRAEALHAT